MDFSKEILNLVRSIAQDPDIVEVKELAGLPMAVEVEVSERDYQLVSSKISVIKTLAASFAGLPEGQFISLQVTPI